MPSRIMPESSVFTREVEVDKCEKPILLYQQEVGDVSCVVWDAALVLASYLQKLDSENEKYFKDRKVLELGAGVGCVGLTAACLGAEVVLTDLPEVIPLLERNICANCDLWKSRGRATARPLRWQNEDAEVVVAVALPEKPDILILADCVYYSESVPSLVATMRRVCHPDTEVLISQEMRPSEKQRAIWTEFVDFLCQSFTLTQIPLCDQHPRYSCSDIFLFKCKLKQR